MFCMDYTTAFFRWFVHPSLGVFVNMAVGAFVGIVVWCIAGRLSGLRK